MLNAKNEKDIASIISANINKQNTTIQKISYLHCKIYECLEDNASFANQESLEGLMLLVDMLFDYLCDIRKDNKECSEYAEKLKDMLEAKGKDGAEQ